MPKHALSYYIDEPIAKIIPYLDTFRKKPSLAPDQILVSSQSESGTKNPKTSSGIDYHNVKTYTLLIHR